MERGAAVILDFPGMMLPEMSHSLEGARGYLQQWQQDESSKPWRTPHQGQELELCACVTCFFGFTLSVAVPINCDKSSSKLMMSLCLWGCLPWGCWIKELPGHITQAETPVHRLLLLCRASASCLGLMLCPFSHPIIFPSWERHFLPHFSSLFQGFMQHSVEGCWSLQTLKAPDPSEGWSKVLSANKLWRAPIHLGRKRSQGSSKEQRSGEMHPPTTTTTWAANTSCPWLKIWLIIDFKNIIYI